MDLLLVDGETPEMFGFFCCRCSGGGTGFRFARSGDWTGRGAQSIPASEWSTGSDNLLGVLMETWWRMDNIVTKCNKQT